MMFRLRPLRSLNGTLAAGITLGLLASPANGLPRAEALRTGAARYEAGPLNVSAAAEASIYTPAGFAKPGEARTASGEHVGQLKLLICDKATGKPTFCRVNVVGPDGNFYQPKQNHLAPFGLNKGWKDRVNGLPRGNRPGVPPVRYYGRFFYCSGDAVVDVPAGPVRVEVWKGFEYRPATLATRVEAGQTRTAELTIERTLPMAAHGYYSGDPHLHFLRQSPEDDELILDLMEADDTHFGAILAYNHPPGPYTGVMQGLDAPQLRGMGLPSIRQRGDYHILSGQEYRSTTYGHINFYAHDGLVLPDQEVNADDWPLYGQLGKEIQKAGGYAFYAHGGYAQAIYADLVQGNVNGVELLQFAVYRGMGLEDWYHILNAGFRFPALGASDYPWCRVLGDSKTYVEVESEPNFNAWLKGTSEGRSFITSGPMLLLEVIDASSGQSFKPGTRVSKTGDGPQRMAARVRVRSEVAPVTNVQLIVNGAVVEEMVTPLDQGTGRWLTLECPIELTESSWVAARAFSKTDGRAANAESHTNPVYVYLHGKAPYRQQSLDELVDRIDRQITFHQQRDFERKADVLAYFERSRDILLMMRAAGGASAEGHPANIADGAEETVEKVGAAAPTDEELKDFLKPVPPKSPAEAQKTMETVDSFRMELVAHEPLVCDPIAAEFDENGQLYVCEMRDYPYRPKPGAKPLGAIRLLRDADADGVFDESHVFADGLLWAGGVAPWKGGVFVTAPPDIWYLKDTDGDFQADVRRKVFTGFGTQNQQAMLNNLKYGLDHMLYGSTAGNGGLVRPGDNPDAPGISVAGRDFRFDPNTLAFETITGTIQFGNTFDDWGKRFVCDQARPLMHIVLPQHYLARNPFLLAPTAINNIAGASVPIFRISPTERWRQIRSNRRTAQNISSAAGAGVSHHVIDAAAGVTIYRGAAYPKKYYGNAFVGDAQNNLVHRRTLTPDGVTFQSERGDQNTEFVRSSDNWFRPVNFVNAPDGTLYVLDMSREIIESIHIPSDLAKHIDLKNGRNQGRIYRLAPPGFRAEPPPRLGAAKTPELVAALENRHGWWRETAHRLIHERQDSTAAPALRSLLNSSRVPQARLLALWSLHGLDALTEADLRTALADSLPEIREHAIRLTEPRLEAFPAIKETLFSLKDDLSPRVCFQLAFTLGEVKDGRAVGALARLGRRYAGDSWIRTAILSSAANTADHLLLELVHDAQFAHTREGMELLSQLAQVIGGRCDKDEVDRVIVSLGESVGNDATAKVHEAIALGLGGGLKQSGGSLPSPSALPPRGAKALATLINRATKTARDSQAKIVEREQAIKLLGCLEYETAHSALAELLDPLEPQAIQLAVLDALVGYEREEISSLVLENWQGYAPAVRGQAIRLLLSRDSWSMDLLTAIEQGRASAGEIDAADRGHLLTHRSDAIRQVAKQLFNESPRNAVLAEYRAVLEQAGDARRGEEIFMRECSACHRVRGQGHDIGPDLTSTASRDAEALLTNILDPNRYVAPAYLQYLIVTSSGRAYSGAILGETATSITLASGKGVNETILRTNIDQLVSAGKSLMPEGFEQTISKSEMADLLAFLGDVLESHAAEAPPMHVDAGTQPGLLEP